MNDLNKDVLEAVNQLNGRIAQKKKTIALANILRDEKLTNLSRAIFVIQSIILNCLQFGNYRRACKYIFIANNILTRIENNEDLIVEKITEKIVDDEGRFKDGTI